MKIIVDSNILFSFFWRQSVVKRILFLEAFTFLSPAYALKEINKYQDEIEQKAKITHWQFDEQLKILKELVVFVDDDEYNKNYKEALEISPDSNDVDFFALSLHENAPLWSNYGDLKKQNAIKVFSTKEMIELVG
ncbi:hypothetical protein J4232_00620 [Candidatus Woesearchaeota archaeon]|nr:hypothetical protein [Candidatus Woesearchaeota archaeon]